LETRARFSGNILKISDREHAGRNRSFCPKPGRGVKLDPMPRTAKSLLGTTLPRRKRLLAPHAINLTHRSNAASDAHDAR
jgi:hypothetical protein